MTVAPLTSATRALVSVVILCAVAGSCFSLRRRFIATWFRDGQPAAAPALPQPADRHTQGLSAVPAVRVWLIDGLDGGTAAALPELSRLCASGLELELDVGFPTVSLPVQAVLWTGRTQQQSGLLYRVKALALPPQGSLPLRTPGSVAVAEDQSFIAGSFGFGRLIGPASGDFARQAAEAVAGEAPLVFVHVLRVDKAGHKGEHQIYLQAAQTADQLLAEALQVAPPGPQRRWFVLSDHGHRRGGGHGGARPDVRLVRACVAGGVGAGQGRAHLVDLSRALSDSLGLAPNEASAGRPLPFALQHPGPRGAALPALPWARFLLAGALVWLCIAAGRRALGGAWAPAWLWLAAAYAGVLLGHGALDLSNPAIYPPLGRDLLVWALPGFVVLVGWRVRGAQVALGPAAGALAPALGGALGALVGCGGIAALIDAGAGPPLERITTAQASALLLLSGGGALALALGTLAVAVRGRLAVAVRARWARGLERRKG
jgi:hypothetical protein